jgi:hypothetical protein
MLFGIQSFSTFVLNCKIVVRGSAKQVQLIQTAPRFHVTSTGIRKAVRTSQFRTCSIWFAGTFVLQRLFTYGKYIIYFLNKVENLHVLVCL